MSSIISNTRQRIRLLQMPFLIKVVTTFVGIHAKSRSSVSDQLSVPCAIAMISVVHNINFYVT